MEFLDAKEWQIAPFPGDESPREFILRVTGKDCEYLRKTPTEDYTWKEVSDANMMQAINMMVQNSGLPSLLLQKSSPHVVKQVS